MSITVMALPKNMRTKEKSEETQALELRLLREALKGNRDAFGELVMRYRGQSLRIAVSMTGDSETARDLTQEAFIKAWRKLGSLRDEAAFGAWLTRIVANAAVSHARRRRFFDPIDGVAMVAAGASLDDRIDVQRLLVRLAPRQRAVLYLTAIEGMTDHEIGDALGISKSSVRAHRLRGRRRLAEMVKGGGGP